MWINNTEPIKDNGQGQSSLRSFVCSGQTTIHFQRMFEQVMREVAGVYLIAVAVVVGHRFEIVRERQTHDAEVVTHGVLNRLQNESGIGDG